MMEGLFQITKSPALRTQDVLELEDMLTQLPDPLSDSDLSVRSDHSLDRVSQSKHHFSTSTSSRDRSTLSAPDPSTCKLKTLLSDDDDDQSLEMLRITKELSDLRKENEDLKKENQELKQNLIKIQQFQTQKSSDVSVESLQLKLAKLIASNRQERSKERARIEELLEKLSQLRT
ncbi:hypothetical protein RCL1_005477 [Eukaryota sp. TZLM3-RCL]